MIVDILTNPTLDFCIETRDILREHGYNKFEGNTVKYC